MTIGKVIRKYRKLANLTQEEMAVRLGVTAPAVNKWEKKISMSGYYIIGADCQIIEHLSGYAAVVSGGSDGAGNHRSR